MINAKSLPTYQQFKVKKKIIIKEKKKRCGSSALEEEKQPEGNFRSKGYALRWQPPSSFPA